MRSLKPLITKFLKLQKASFNKDRLALLVDSHPDFLSLNNITDTFDNLNIPNAAVEIKLGQLQEIQLPVITTIYLDGQQQFAIINKVKNQDIYLILESLQELKIPCDNFFQLSYLVIVIVEVQKKITLSKGDSVIVDYINGKPYFKILNKKTYPFDNAFDEKFNNSEPLPLTIAYFKYNSIWDTPKKGEFIKTSIEYDKNLNICLDSLHNNKLISQEFYDLRRNFNNYLLTTYVGKPAFDFSSISKDAQDSLMLYNFFRFALRDFANNMLSKAKLIKTSNGSVIDSRVVYDSVRNSNTLSLTAKKYLLFSNIQLIAQSFSQKDFSNYFTKFENDIKDTALISIIKDKYLFNLTSLKEESQKLNIVDLNKNEFTLTNYLERTKRKLFILIFGLVGVRLAEKLCLLL